MSNPNPSWSPALHPEADDGAVSHLSLDATETNPYYLDHSGRFVRTEEIVSPDLLAAIRQKHYLVRQIKQTWWMTVEHEQAPFASPQDTFLIRRDDVMHDMHVRNPTEEERATLKQKKLFNKQEMGYFRSIWITVEYGSTYDGYDGNQRWTRHTVAFLKDGVSPYPFTKDCRPEHHKQEFFGF
jgi:hypothetical protein